MEHALKVCPPSDLKETNILYSYVYQTIVDQVNHDKNIRTLLQDIHDIFNLRKLVNSLGDIKSSSMQAQILTAMLWHVCNCGNFIQLYMRNTTLCMSLSLNSFLTLKHVIGRAVNHEVFHQARQCTVWRSSCLHFLTVRPFFLITLHVTAHSLHVTMHRLLHLPFPTLFWLQDLFPNYHRAPCMSQLAPFSNCKTFT